ncbi:hypothetical protein [Paenibacillus glycinis]|nr:hypothetical protein [Paenibacillus glycinis]
MTMIEALSLPQRLEAWIIVILSLAGSRPERRAVLKSAAFAE